MEVKRELAGRTFSILGDSYSTFEGYIPDGHACYYPRVEAVDDVLCVEDTWWYKLMHRSEMRLLVNNSYSGSTVCSQVRDDHPKSASYVERAKCSFLGANGEQPDYIFVFGCTNDSWLERPIGRLKFGGWTAGDLKQVLPAYCCVLNRISKNYPQTKIVTVVNTALDPAISEGMVLAANYYRTINIVLEDVDKQRGHPTALGMTQIADQIEQMIRSSL